MLTSCFFVVDKYDMLTISKLCTQITRNEFIVNFSLIIICFHQNKLNEFNNVQNFKGG